MHIQTHCLYISCHLLSCRMLFGLIGYLAVGMVYNRFSKGLRGIHVLPNYTFWYTGVIFVVVRWVKY